MADGENISAVEIENKSVVVEVVSDIADAAASCTRKDGEEPVALCVSTATKDSANQSVDDLGGKPKPSGVETAKSVEVHLHGVEITEVAKAEGVEEEEKSGLIGDKPDGEHSVVEGGDKAALQGTQVLIEGESKSEISGGETGPLEANVEANGTLEEATNVDVKENEDPANKLSENGNAVAEENVAPVDDSAKSVLPNSEADGGKVEGNGEVSTDPSDMESADVDQSVKATEECVQRATEVEINTAVKMELAVGESTSEHTVSVDSGDCDMEDAQEHDKSDAVLVHDGEASKTETLEITTGKLVEQDLPADRTALAEVSGDGSSDDGSSQQPNLPDETANDDQTVNGDATTAAAVIDETPITTNGSNELVAADVVIKDGTPRECVVNRTELSVVSAINEKPVDTEHTAVDVNGTAGKSSLESTEETTLPDQSEKMEEETSINGEATTDVGAPDSLDNPDDAILGKTKGSEAMVVNGNALEVSVQDVTPAIDVPAEATVSTDLPVVNGDSTTSCAPESMEDADESYDKIKRRKMDLSESVTKLDEQAVEINGK